MRHGMSKHQGYQEFIIKKAVSQLAKCAKSWAKGLAKGVIAVVGYALAARTQDVVPLHCGSSSHYERPYTCCEVKRSYADKEHHAEPESEINAVIAQSDDTLHDRETQEQ